MADIRGWLDGLGLGEFFESFEAERIEFDDLPDLTDTDLEKLGVPMGPRKRLIRAISTLETAPDAVARNGDTEAESAKQSSLNAERRQLTVMFCDLVGSTALSERLDPEDLRDLMAAYRKAAGDVVARYDGHVAQYLGDGVMAYFGWPRAHEDDAERAVRAGLDIIDAVKLVGAAESLALRIGIATGPVVVGEGDDDASANKLAVGETPNLAARLQGLAGADEIVIGVGTRQLIGGAFEVDDLGPRNLKGILVPVPAWQVKGASAIEGRFEARATGGLTPLIGRETEIQLMLDRWQHTKDGEGQVVLLEGEPGIGKSRITQELRERVADEPHFRLRYQCSPYYTNSALYPVISQLERASAFARDDTPDQKLDKLESALAQGTDDVAKVAPLYAAILALPLDRYPPLNLSPKRQKDDTIAALAAQVTGLAQQRPVLIVFEDAHWCDPITLETLSAVIGAIESAPVMIVITYRPEFEPPWTGYGHVVTQSLSRLGKRQGAEMVTRVAGGKALPGDVLDQIVAKTDGIPLFVEELTKTVTESGAGTADTIPETLQDSLMARLDQLSPVKEIAQIGACIGRRFSHRLLAAVAPISDNILEDALHQLINSELIHRSGEDYVFKHALVQDAAYQSLLKSRRVQLHQNLAEALETDFADICAGEPETLAHHFTEAGLGERAAPHWRAAGQLAMRRFANNEAIVHFNRGLEAIETVPAGTGRDRLELSIMVPLATARVLTTGYAHPDVERDYLRALALADSLKSDDEILGALFGIAIVYWARARIDLCEPYVRRMLDLAEASRDPAWIVAAEFVYGAGVSLMRSELIEARHHLERCYHLSQEHDFSNLVHTLGLEPGIFAMGYLSNTLSSLGYFDQGRRMLEETIDRANALGHPMTRAFTLSACLTAMVGFENPDLIYSYASEGVACADEQGLTDWLGLAMVIRGMAQINRGETSDGLAECERGFEIRYSAGSQELGHQYCLMAGHIRAGNPRAALEISERILPPMRAGNSLWAKPVVLLFRGDALRDLDPPQECEAELSYKEALEIAQARSAKLPEVEAAIALARLWRDQGRRDEARALLAPLYSWFTEGLDTRPLTEAKALLEELS